jgi:hypothetical protein
MFALRKILLVSVAFLAFLVAPRVFAAAYQFVEGYNVLDTNNAPVFATGPIGTNFAATAGQERDIAVDAARGIIYMGRGQGTVPDGRSGAGAAISAFVVTNGAREGSNFRDTGLIGAASGQPTFTWCQSLAYDRGSDKLWVLGSPLSANPVIFCVPGGTLGGAPNGDNISAINAALVKAFQVDTNLLDVGVYVSPTVSTNGTPGRGGAPRGIAVRTVNGTNTTVYVGMGNHVQAWSNDQPMTDTNSAWRRVWATQRPPAGNLTTSRVGLTGFNGVNGVAVDDAGNCYFSVQTTGGRIWTVRPALVQSAPDLMSLDYNDLPFGGSSGREVLPLLYSASASAPVITPPQSLTFCRFDNQRSLFVGLTATTRAVTRLDIDDSQSFTNGGAYLRAVAVDGFGSGQPAAGQDSILSTMRLKAGVGVTQPYGATQGLLYTDVDSVTNPSHIYVDAFVTDTNKGQTIPTAAIIKVQIPYDTNAPSITVPPQAQTLLEGGTISLSVGAAGQLPLQYQWQSNSLDILGATNRDLSIVPASTNHSALYRVIVSNIHSNVVSTQAQVTVNPLVRSAAMTPLWRLAPGERFYLTVDDKQRGLAYNPNTGNLLVVSRAPSNSIHVLSAQDGSEQFPLVINPATVTGGTFDINMIGASDDGYVYVGNLAQGGADFRIYRWASEDTEAAPTLAYSGNPTAPVGNRWGDTFAVRGIGFDDTLQIIAGTRNSNVVAIFTSPDDGDTLSPTVIQVPDAPNGAFGLGVAFGRGDTFWGKGDSAAELRLVQFDLAHGTGAVLRTYASNAYPATAIGFEPNLNVLAAISIQNPDNLRLYDVSDSSSAPRLVDQELFAADNDNINATGAIDFGGGKVFALDSNNGLIALTLGAIPPPPPGRITITRTGPDVKLTWSGNYTLQASPSVTGQYEDVPGARSGYTEATASATQKFFRLRN